jgi:Arc/MetJ-type ribon-helix-helix transcriptional regulator
MSMTGTLSPDLRAFVRRELADGRFENEEQLVAKALELYRELRQSHEQFRAEVRQSLEQARQGDVAELDIEAIIARGTRRLAEEGITD